ncbi:MAG: HD-GYP domain-containing protein [Candidatus Eremiobacteraeota bacterium]|nr:HD-GYP domain-containing protein [Candidatus Eremiobacteraeota bacterium]
MPIDRFTGFIPSKAQPPRALPQATPNANAFGDMVSLGQPNQAGGEGDVTIFWSQALAAPGVANTPELQSVAARNLGSLTWNWLRKAFPECDQHPRKALEALLHLFAHSSPFNYTHSNRVAELAKGLAEELELDSEERQAVQDGIIFREVGMAAVGLGSLTASQRDQLAEAVRASGVSMDDAGALHDIGKLHIPSGILNKNGRLSEEEFEVVRLHPVVGECLLRPIASLASLLPAVRGHHERWDGNGYPDGLSEQEIPVSARILTLADSFDAMIGERPYREAMNSSQALIEIVRGSGSQFDPELAGIFVRRLSRSL